MARAPLVLIVSEHEWASRSLGSVISPRGYAVLWAHSGERAIEKARHNEIDALVVDAALPDTTGEALLREMLGRDLITRAAPVLYLASRHANREQKIRAMEAGAWHVLAFPLDADELTLRLERFIQGKLEANRLREDALVDADTGLYSRQGIYRRIGEVAAAAARHGRPLSCIVLLTEEDVDSEPDAVAHAVEIPTIASRLRSAVRTSDLLARIGPDAFAVVAPDTPQQGARILADRLRESLGHGDGPGGRLRTGIYAVDDPKTSSMNPLEFIARATPAAARPRPN